MSTEAYIELVHRNLKGELSPEEFGMLNKLTAQNAELANTRIEIEDAWDVSGEEQVLVKKEETEKLFQKITKAKSTNASIFSIRNVITGVAALFILALSSLWLMRDQTKIYSEEGLIRLADNSTVELREGSRLEVKTFTDNTRNVTLAGEAFFDIEKDAKRPFIISTASTQVEVLGTSFLVKEAGVSVFVSVEEGRVRFTRQNSAESIELTKGMTAECNENGLSIIQYQNLSGWKSGIFQYQDQELSEIVQELSLVFNSSIEVENQQLLNCRISAILTAENLKDILNQLAGQLEWNAKQDGQNWSLSGRKCK